MLEEAFILIAGIIDGLQNSRSARDSEESVIIKSAWSVICLMSSSFQSQDRGAIPNATQIGNQFFIFLPVFFIPAREQDPLSGKDFLLTGVRFDHLAQT